MEWQGSIAKSLGKNRYKHILLGVYLPCGLYGVEIHVVAFILDLIEVMVP